jgi:hypothetical protein
MGRRRNSTKKRGGEKRVRTFSSLLNRIAYEIGGRKKFFEFARQCIGEDIQKVVQLWDQADQKEFTREHFNIDEACAQCGVQSSRILAEVVAIAFEHAKEHGKLLAAINFPKIIQATIDSASSRRGVKDRQYLLQNANFIPSPSRGAAVVINNKNQQQTNVAQPAPTGELEPFHATAATLGRAFRGELTDGT